MDEYDQLYENSASEFSCLVDLGDTINSRYVIRWRNGIKGLQAYYEGNEFKDFVMMNQNVMIIILQMQHI